MLEGDEEIEVGGCVSQPADESKALERMERVGGAEGTGVGYSFAPAEHLPIIMAGKAYGHHPVLQASKHLQTGIWQLLCGVSC